MQPKIPKRGVRCEFDSLNIQNPSQHALQATRTTLCKARYMLLRLNQTTYVPIPHQKSHLKEPFFAHWPPKNPAHKT